MPRVSEVRTCTLHGAWQIRRDSPDVGKVRLEDAERGRQQKRICPKTEVLELSARYNFEPLLWREYQGKSGIKGAIVGAAAGPGGGAGGSGSRVLGSRAPTATKLYTDGGLDLRANHVLRGPLKETRGDQAGLLWIVTGSALLCLPRG